MGELNKKIFELTLAVYRVTDIFPKDEVLKRQIREKANEILSSVCEYDRKIGENNARFLLAKIQAIRTYFGVARFSNLVKAVNTAVLDREYEFFANFFERELACFTEKIAEEEEKNKSIPQIQTASTSIKNIRKPKVERSIIYPVRSKNNNHVVGNGNYTGHSNSMHTFAKWTSNGVNSQKVSLENGNGNGNGNGNSLSNGYGNGIEQNNHKSIVNKETNGFNERRQTILDYIRQNQAVKSVDLSQIFSNKFSIKTLQRDLAALIGNNTIERQGDKRWAIYKIKA